MNLKTLTVISCPASLDHATCSLPTAPVLLEDHTLLLSSVSGCFSVGLYSSLSSSAA
jgi:hypothetical protein